VLPYDETLAGTIVVYTRLINAVMTRGIKLSTGQMKPPQLFDPSTLTPPLTEPPPIQLKRATSAAGARVRVPDLVAANGEDVALLIFCLAHHRTLQGCLDESIPDRTRRRLDPTSSRRSRFPQPELPRPAPDHLDTRITRWFVFQETEAERRHHHRLTVTTPRCRDTDR
jgi:hypothetical protein